MEGLTYTEVATVVMLLSKVTPPPNAGVFLILDSVKGLSNTGDG